MTVRTILVQDSPASHGVYQVPAGHRLIPLSISWLIGNTFGDPDEGGDPIACYISDTHRWGLWAASTNDWTRQSLRAGNRVCYSGQAYPLRDLTDDGGANTATPDKLQLGSLPPVWLKAGALIVVYGAKPGTEPFAEDSGPIGPRGFCREQGGTTVAEVVMVVDMVRTTLPALAEPPPLLTHVET